MADFGLSRVVDADLTSQHHDDATLTLPRERTLSMHQRTLQPAEAEVRVDGSVDYEQGDLLDAADEAGAGAGDPRVRPGLPSLPTPTHSQRFKVPRTAPEASAGPGPGTETEPGPGAGPGPGPDASASASAGPGAVVAAKGAVPPRVPLSRSLTKHVVGAGAVSLPPSLSLPPSISADSPLCLCMYVCVYVGQVTRWYRSPELILCQPYSAAVDIW